jgi:hypothetical protein
MRPLALLLTGALLAATGFPALAAPPAVGSHHRFEDPVFRGTIFCDTCEQVRHIATSPSPQETYANYAILTNDRDESICFAIVPTGLVKSVTPLGIMVENGRRYEAWAVETDVGGTIAYGLYLENLGAYAAI